jgi:transposase
MGKRREYSREFKLSAVKRVLAGEQVPAVAAELQTANGRIYSWVHHYRQGGVEALRPARRPRKGFGVLELESGKDLATARRRIEELERKVGQQQVELDFFRQALRQVGEARRPSDGPGARTSTRSSRR